MKIAYVGSFEFPDGGPGTVHVIGVANALRELGHEVVFFSNKKITQNPTAETTENDDRVHTHKDFKYRPLEYSGTGIGERFRRQISVTIGASVFERLETEELSGGPFNALIIYQPQSLLFYRVRHWCRKRKIPLICDVVEWFDPSQFKGGRYGYHYLDSELNMKKSYFLSDGILAISSYLEQHYSNRGLPTLRMPNLIDIHHCNWTKIISPSEEGDSKRLCLCFVGTAGYKDLLVNAVRGLSMLGTNECKIVIIGPSRKEVKLSLGSDSSLLETLREKLFFSGRLPHSEALAKLAQSDFSILLRPNARFTDAGFPTKLVESLAAGVPVICNLTGDIGLYVHDGYEGIVVSDHSPESFADGIRRALSMSSAERLAMCRQARKTAELSFDYRNWVAPLGGFMDRVVANVNQQK